MSLVSKTESGRHEQMKLQVHSPAQIIGEPTVTELLFSLGRGEADRNLRSAPRNRLLVRKRSPTLPSQLVLTPTGDHSSDG